jgi:hypothetical protein
VDPLREVEAESLPELDAEPLSTVDAAAFDGDGEVGGDEATGAEVLSEPVALEEEEGGATCAVTGWEIVAVPTA